MPLTDTAVRQARPRERAYKLSESRGLCLLVQPNGSKWWRYRYRWERTEQMLKLGVYPIPHSLKPGISARPHARRWPRELRDC
jgi:hypothetical protein